MPSPSRDTVITYPWYGDPANEWAVSVRELCVKHHRIRPDVIGRRGTLLWHNRNEIAKKFLATDAEWTLMTDNDMVFTNRDINYLFGAAEEYGPGVYSGVVMSLGPKGIHPIFGDWLPERQTCRFWDDAPPAGEPFPIAIVPTALLLVHRSVFEKIGEDGWFEHLRTIDGENRILGEDIAFSLRCMEAGFTPILVPNCRPGHVKKAIIYPDGARPIKETS